MTWESAGKYAVTNGEYTISKASVNGVWKYTLWRGESPGVMMGIFPVLADAKKGVDNEQS